MRPFPDWSADQPDDGPTPTHILGLGMGVDSAAILLRWMHEPDTRPFTSWADLVVVTAQTGDEHPTTGRDVEQHLYPLLRQHGVRTIQVARGQRHVTKAGEGVVVLDDTTAPTVCHVAGAYKLSTEMTENGTVPQTGGARLCSVHSKGDALDPVIDRLTRGRPFVHVVGFEMNEPKRVEKDRGYNTDVRTGAYPLVEWGWDRATCEAYILSRTGVDWQKSACVFCPFALANAEGRTRTLARWAADPQTGVDTLMMEYASRALNPSQTLVGKVAAYDLVLSHAGAAAVVLPAFQAALDATPLALYEVRRIRPESRVRPGKPAPSNRSVRRWAEGDRAQLLTDLHDLAATYGATVDTSDGFPRVWVRRGEGVPSVDHLFVIAPAVILDKERPQFDGWWEDALAAADALPAPQAADVQPSLFDDDAAA